MGSFEWDFPCHQRFHNGRLLSVAMTEACTPDIPTCFDSNFALVQQPLHCTSGRRFRREYFNTFHPNICYGSCRCLPAMPCRPMYRCASRDAICRNFETVTVEHQHIQPVCNVVRCVRSPSPIIRELRVRSRPVSCVDLRRGEMRETQPTKCVDEYREERFEYRYDYNFPRQPSPPVIIPAPPKPERPKPKLSVSEMERFDLYEQEEKIKKDIISTEQTTTTTTTRQQPVIHRYHEYHTSNDEFQTSSRSTIQQEFAQNNFGRNDMVQTSTGRFSCLDDSNFGTRSATRPRKIQVELVRTNDSTGFNVN